ncbi:MAG: TIGR03905 family TSCPD domain-containing protein [Clostridia bacterium]|nr:TIGR03905 family TSCPD domain-containing protein [Clostridia bacterium]
MLTYLTKGTCSKQILYDVTPDNKLHNVKFVNGCSGNLQGISKLVEGKDIDEVIALLSGIKCRANTSCPDQLATALKEYKARNADK